MSIFRIELAVNSEDVEITEGLKKQMHKKLEECVFEHNKEITCTTFTVKLTPFISQNMKQESFIAKILSELDYYKNKCLNLQEIEK